jgi:hypothetical protein
MDPLVKPLPETISAQLHPMKDEKFDHVDLPSQHGIKLFASSANLENSLSLLSQLMGSNEARGTTRHALRNSLFDLVHLYITEAFDIKELLLGAHGHELCSVSNGP